MLPDKEKKIFVCSCGNSSKDGKITLTEINSKEFETIDVIEEDHNVNPLTDAECPKCKHIRAHWWSVQMRGADEPESIFFRCEKCKHTWRQK